MASNLASVSTDLNELAQSVSAAAKTITDFFAANNLPPLSFAKDGPLDFPPAPTDIQDARRTLREASKTLLDLATGPVDLVIWTSTSYNDCSSLQYIYRYNIPAAVPLDGEITFNELASKVGANEKQLRHVLRYAMTNHVFNEPRIGYVGHSAASKLLAVSPALLDLVGYSTDDTFSAATKLVDAFKKYPASEEMNETPFQLAFNTDLPTLRYFEQDPIRGPRFARAMESLAASDGHNIRHVVNGFDWTGLGPGVVVDVGGSIGHSSIAMAEVAPQLKFVVQDLPPMVAQGQKALPEKLKDRISFMAHDFFKPQPVQADTYFLRFILHDYPDKYAALLLQNLVPALKHGSRLIVMDGVMPPPGVNSPSVEKVMRGMDMVVMSLLNAYERDLSEWTALFARADPRFKLKNIVLPPGSVMSVMEVIFEEPDMEK